jgi:hypothetical protein
VHVDRNSVHVECGAMGCSDGKCKINEFDVRHCIVLILNVFNYRLEEQGMRERF